jgi:hypothetical protein
MKETTIKLSASGLANIQMQNDFDFIVGKSHHCCPSFIADFLSPKLAQLHTVDPTINNIILSTEDRYSNFDSFLSLGRGQSIRINSENRDFFVSLSSELGNLELSFLFLNSASTEKEITRENVFLRLADWSHANFESDFHLDFSREIAFVASHFHDFSKSELSDLNLSILSEIVSSNDLKIASEDQLYEVLWDFVDQDRSNFNLLSFVRFEYLSSSTIRRFIDSVSSFLDLFNSSIWSRLSSRLLLGVSTEVPNDRVAVSEVRSQRFSPTSDSPLNGIISHLTSKYGRNIHDQGVVIASASSTNGNPAKYVLDLQNHSSCFQSHNEANGWICIDFKDMCIIPTHYSILSCTVGPGYFHPKSWCFEVSDDGNKWTEVHRCTNSNDVNGRSLIGIYSVSTSMKCRFFRFRQTGKDHGNNYHLTLSGFEIFGTLFEP